jgi:hypothetical protein
VFIDRGVIGLLFVRLGYGYRRFVTRNEVSWKKVTNLLRRVSDKHIRRL